MKIGVIGDAVLATPTEGGHGLGRMVSQIAEHLRLRGHDVTLFAKPGSRFSGELVTPADANGYAGEIALAREALRLHKMYPVDCFLDHSHLHKLSELLPGLPCINVFHDNYQRYQRCAVLLSEGQRALLSDAFANARVIPNALNPHDFGYAMEPADPPYAFWCGALSDIKQPLLAIEACARMGVKLIMAGAPLAGQLPISKHEGVDYIGPVNAATRNRLMAFARVFLQLGTVESFGLTTLEANLCGCPVVAWPSGGSLDQIAYGVNGVFVPLLGKDTVGNVVDAMERAWDMDRDAVRAYATAHTSIERQIDAYEHAMIDCVMGRWW